MISAKKACRKQGNKLGVSGERSETGMGQGAGGGTRKEKNKKKKTRTERVKVEAMRTLGRTGADES